MRMVRVFHMQIEQLPYCVGALASLGWETPPLPFSAYTKVECFSDVESPDDFTTLEAAWERGQNEIVPSKQRRSMVLGDIVQISDCRNGVRGYMCAALGWIPVPATYFSQPTP